MKKKHLKLVEREVQRCISIATRHFKYKFYAPFVKYDLKGQDAGYADPETWTIHLNPKYFEKYHRSQIYATVPHEIAHLIDVKVNLKRFAKAKRQPWHGKTWKEIMALFGVEPNRTHNMN